MKLTSRHELLIPLAVVALVLVALVVGSLVWGIFGFKGGGEGVGRLATASLVYALPDAYTESGDFKGLLHFDASTMNRLRKGIGRRLHFVSETTPSNGPDVVSVNVIDNFTWGAAALSRQDGTCYLILLLVDSADTSQGTTKYGILAPGAPCLGNAVSVSTTVDQEWP